MTTRGKKYKEASKLVEGRKLYEPKEAVAIVKKAGYAKFDETVELHFNLNLDLKASDQGVRGTVVLPHGIGKKVRVAAICIHSPYFFRLRRHKRFVSGFIKIPLGISHEDYLVTIW